MQITYEIEKLCSHFTFLRRALCHDHLNEHDNAVRDWTALCAQDPHNGDLTFYVFVLCLYLCLCCVTLCCVCLCVFVTYWTALCAHNPHNGDIPSSVCVCVCVYVCVCICFCICVFLID